MKSIRKLGLRFERAYRRQRWLLRQKHCRQVRDHWIEFASTLKPPSAHLPTCLLDLHDIDLDGEQGRRFHQLVSLLTHGGYTIYLNPRLSFLQTAHRAFKAEALRKVRPLSHLTRPPVFDLYLTDRMPTSDIAEQTMIVTADQTRPIGERELPLPYGPFPSVWNEDWERDLGSHRKTPRTWRLFFGGHCSEASYTKIRKYERMAVLNRFQVVETTKHHFASDIAPIQNDRSFKQLLSMEHDGFVFLDNGIYRTPAGEWLTLLARSRFFLAAPGGDYPLSHNLVESMAVGTIPVIEYASLMTPPLEDGVNCIHYEGKAGLRESLQRVRSMNEMEIERLQEGVIDYYESHLTSRAFVQAIETGLYDCVHMMPYLTPERQQRLVAA
ncbi:MAG: hypothetical protein AAFV88_16350 [Planctomycetota bacterium]